jgi:hypothetical protein
LFPSKSLLIQHMVFKRGGGEASATPVILNLRKLLLRSNASQGQVLPKLIQTAAVVARTIVLFVAGYIVFRRQEVRARPLRLPAVLLTFLGRHSPKQGPRKIISCDRVQRRRNQFIGFGRAAPSLGLEPLGFLNIVDGELAQSAEFDIVGNWIRRQQIPGARTGAVVSHAYHEAASSESSIFSAESLLPQSRPPNLPSAPNGHYGTNLV